MEGWQKMINRLINMEIPEINTTPKEVSIDNANYTITDYANAFIKGMSETQQNRFKKMLENGMNCGMSVADNYGINYG